MAKRPNVRVPHNRAAWNPFVGVKGLGARGFGLRTLRIPKML